MAVLAFRLVFFQAAFAQRNDGHSQEQQQRDPVEQPAPPAQDDQPRQVSGDTQRQGRVQQPDVAVEVRPVADVPPQHRGEDHRRVAEDHPEDEAQKQRVQLRIIDRPAACWPKISTSRPLTASQT